jgi:hypothetical protein
MTETAPRPIIVVGDWVVDEYWFLAKHQSEISSHTGFVHYRIANKPDEYIRDLCGAGHVARTLFELSKRDGVPVEISGIGIWHQSDSKLILDLIHSRSEETCEVAKTNGAITINPCQNLPPMRILSLHAGGPTIQVIRQYHKEELGLVQINRVDFEPQAQFQYEDKHDSLLESNLEYLRNLTDPDIVIHDLGKGSVSDRLIAKLRAMFKDARWYVRTKNMKQEWIRQLKGIRLLLLGPEITSLFSPWDTWINNNHVSKLVLEKLEDVPQAENTLLLTDAYEVIVKNSSGHLILSQSLAERYPIDLGWASSVFAATTWELITRDEGEVTSNVLDVSLPFADKHQVMDIPRNIGLKRPKTIRPPQINEPIEWKREKDCWEHAMRFHGLITIGGEKCLQVNTAGLCLVHK